MNQNLDLTAFYGGHLGHPTQHPIQLVTAGQRGQPWLGLWSAKDHTASRAFGSETHRMGMS